MISMVSATSLNYNDQTRTATVSKTFLFWETGKIASAQLLTPLNYKVGLGEQYVWEMKVTGFDNYNDFVHGMDFYDRKNGMAKINKNYDLRKKEITQISVNDYSCEDVFVPINQTTREECWISGSHYEDQEIWTKLKQVDFKKNDVLFIRMYVFVEEGDHVEWIPTIANERVSQWAEWTADLNTDLIVFMAMNESSGTLVDDLGTSDGTLTGSLYSQSGLIGTSIGFDGSDRITMNTPTALDNSNVGTFCIWTRATDTTQGTAFIISPYTSTSARGGLYNVAGGMTFGLNVDGGYLGTSSYSWTSNEWTLWCVTQNGTTQNFYRQGVSVENLTTTKWFDDFGTMGKFWLGEKGLDNSAFFVGEMDMFMVWERALTGSEIKDQVYNEGSGNVYTTVFGNNPTVTAISPANNIEYTTSPQSIDFTCYGSDGENFTDMEFYLDESLTQTNSSGINNTNYIFTESLSDGDYNWSCIGYDDEANTDQSATRYLTIDTTPFIDFITPPTLPNYANITQENIPMKVNVSTSYFENITYSLRNVNGTNYIQFYETETYDINFTNMPDAHYHYDVTVCTTTDQCNSTETRHIYHDATPPVITAPTNLTDLLTLSLPINSTWSFNASDPHIDQCYYNTSDHNTTIVTCNSTIQTAWTTRGNKTITSCANDTFGTEICQTDYIWVYYLQETQAVDLDPVGEGTEVEFSLFLNLTDIPSTSAYLVLNNTIYAATTSLAGINAYYFAAEVVIPDGWGNSTGNVLDWNWVYNISGISTGAETETENITVYALEVDDCSSYGDVILNLSLKDEEQNTFLSPPITNFTDVQVDLQIIATDNSSLSWDYSNTWDDDADGIVQICVPSGVLANSEYKFEFVMGFSAEDYVQEFYYLDNGILNAEKQYNSLTTDQINLYDLPLDDSTTFLFKFFDEDNIEVKDGVVHTFRKYIGDGLFREVERSKSDNNGETHVHLVEEDVIYYFKISLESEILFTSASYSAKCLSTPCQIDLEASGEFEEFDNNWDLANGSYSISSDAGTRQVSMLYLLEDPKTMNLTIMKYTNNPDTMEIVGSDEAYSTGGILSVTVPQVAGNISFIAVVYEGGEVIDTEWVDFSPSGSDYFGATGIFMALLLIICLILMASSEGEGTLIFAIIGLIVISSLKLIDLDYYALIGFICALSIVIWKIAERRKR